MGEKLKVYCIALIAFSHLHDADTGAGTYVENVPALVPADSIEEAAQAAREHAMTRWPPSQGWYGHQAAIEPVTAKFFEAAFRAHAAGVVEESADTEAPEVFQFE
jgi:hypothetical protein